MHTVLPAALRRVRMCIEVAGEHLTTLFVKFHYYHLFLFCIGVTVTFCIKNPYFLCLFGSLSKCHEELSELMQNYFRNVAANFVRILPNHAV
jgi:hypothetical protein